MPLFNWTGNPWVDTGIAVMIARAKELKYQVTTIRDLTPDIIEQVCKSKMNCSGEEYSWLTNTNRRLNCYTMIFSSNGPLTNTSTNPTKTLDDLIKKIEQKRAQITETEKELESEKETLINTNNEKDIKKIKNKIKKLEKKIEKINIDIEKDLKKQQKRSDKQTDNRIEDKGLNEYVTIIKGLIEDIKNGTYSTGAFCEATGKFKATSVLEMSGKNIAKEWFPLAGTMSDVQTLPSASRSLRLSALSLLAVQLLPMGTAMLGGKLICFQTNDVAINNVPLFQSMVEEVYRETMQKAALTDKVETWGKDGGYNSITFLLLGRINDLIQRKSLEELPEYICLNLWRFSNTGQDPYLEIIEIPNDAIQFLWEAWRGKLKGEIERYLSDEQNFNKKESQLLQCIKEKKEYHPFYPYKVESKKTKSFIRTPASIELFDLYTVKILGYLPEALAIAKWIAGETKKIIKDKDLQTVKENLSEYYRQIKNIIIKLSEVSLSLEDYLILFPCDIYPLRPVYSKHSTSARIVWFYLNHDIKDAEHPMIGGDIAMVAHPKYPKIKTFAQDFFDYYIGKEGKERFEKRILTAFKQDQVKPYTIEDWFASLAEIKDGYSNEEWDDLCRDENGNNEVWEVLFQLRLELTNLYREKYKAWNQII